MDDVFTDPNDTLSQLTKELKNVSFNLEDIQKTLDKKESQLVKSIQAPKVEIKPETKDAELKTEAPEPLLKAVEKVEEPEQVEPVPELKPLIPEEYLKQPNDAEKTAKPVQVAPQIIQQNLITIEKETQEQKESKPVKPELPKVTVKMPEAVQPQKKQLDILEQKPEIRKQSDIKTDVVNNTAKEQIAQPKTNAEIKNEVVEKILQPQTTVIEKVIEKVQIEPAPQQENLIRNNRVIEQEELAKVEKREPLQQMNNVVKDQGIASAIETADIKSQKMPKLNVQDERSSANSAQPKLEILNEREQKLTPMNSKDVSLVNIEKTITNLVATMNKNNTQLNNQLTSLHQVATEILKILPTLAQQQGNPAAGAQYSREYKTVNFGKINEFRNLTSNLFATVKSDNVPTLT